MPQPTAIWNTARDAWETPGTESLLCGHLSVSSETLPTSGSMRNGAAYALPTWEHRMAGSASSYSPDDEAEDGLLGTPTSRMWKGVGPQGGATQIRNKARGLIEAQVMDLLPTPAANVGTNGGSQHPEKRRAGNHQPSIQDVAEHTLVSSCYDCDCQYGCRGIEDEATNWGPYESAIRRWEAVLSRPAPAPTEPNAKGNHRLNPAFTEWMMGVPEGWITDIPISRNEQLKACGNGVVPQQAAAALGDMLAAFGEAP